jgi:anti-sigma factor RsiW
MAERPFITCRELIEFLYLYLEGELPPERAVEFERHLAVCESCLRYIATYRETVALGKAACAEPDSPVGDEVPEDLVLAIRSARRGER